MFLSNLLLSWKIFVFSSALLSTICLVNTQVTILPTSEINFVICALIAWFLSLWMTLVGLHKLLQKSKPLELDFARFKTNYDPKLEAKPNLTQIKVLSKDIDKYFIKKWYCNITPNEDFNIASQTVLEDVIKKLLQVQLDLNQTVILHGTLNIYLKHLKEFRRTLRRREKYDADTTQLYRYSHNCINSSKSKEYYVHQLTINLLSHFLNWELWNSLPCHVLVSIIARKLIMYLLNTLSSPELINYHLLNCVASKTIRDKYELDKYSKIALIQFFEAFEPEEKIVKEEEPKLLEDKPKEIDEVDCIPTTKPDKILEELPILSTKPVKIYEPKSSKTWDETKDVTSVSFGQDPLEAFPDSLEKRSTLWEYSEATEDSPTNLFNEMKNITTMEGFKSSIKPLSDATVNTLNNIKDLQETTVNNALTKIGDFQDEAAGVVEGLLDFGRAGFRKGLRLTGLQDNIENAKPTKKKTAKLTRSDSQDKMSSGDSTDSVWINPLQLDSPSFDGQILLEKTKKEPEKTVKGETEQPSVPFISMEAPGENESPDPEYEEAADLASTIAKLRSLLQQKSSESSLSTPALSPMPSDDFAQKLALEAEGIEDAEELDGVVPSFIKFCAKTTGVFHKSLNTIKTALPGNLTGPEALSHNERWNFIQKTQSESDLLNRVRKLINERKDFCTVDTAYEAIDSLDSLQTSTDTFFRNNLQYDDELDDFETKLPITKTIIDITCELLSNTDTPLLQEPIVKAVLLTFGATIEKNIKMELDKLMVNFGTNLFTIPETTKNKVLQVNLDEYVEALSSSFPDYIKHLLGFETIQKAVELFVSSNQVKKINQDVLMQIFELLCMHLIDQSSILTPPVSA